VHSAHVFIEDSKCSVCEVGLILQSIFMLLFERIR